MPGIVSALSDPDSVKSQTLPDYQEEGDFVLHLLTFSWPTNHIVLLSC